MPILAQLRRRAQYPLVLFHHEPSSWARERLLELDVPERVVALPARPALGWISHSGARAAVAELAQLWRARRLAQALVADIDPAAVVVIQDTLLLERFLVREADRRGRGTMVVQWAFTFPQSMYDRLHEIQKGRAPDAAAIPPKPYSRVRGARLPARLYRQMQRLLGVHFDLVNSYGGGEARVFAVMGEAFREQFLAQGVRKEQIEVTGHPLHDAAFSRRTSLAAKSIAEVKRRYGLPLESRVILYATQPVLWRAVLTRDQLAENVQALGRAVAALGPEFLLVLKLHPRERPEDYSAAAEAGLPICVLQEAEIAELIGVSEVFISSSSSTVLLAMMLGKPIITVNFNNVPHFDFYETLGGTLHLKNHAAAAQVLRLALWDHATRSRLAEEQGAVLARYARFDGQATERLTNLVLELSGASCG